MLRWAVEAVYRRPGQSVPEEIAEHLERMSQLGRKELRAVLSQVADDCKGDLRRCTDLAFDGMLRHLDEGCNIWASRLPQIIYEPDYVPFGIGVRLNRDRQTGRIRVTYPIHGGPAYKAGLRSGDVIEEIRRPRDPPDKAEGSSSFPMSPLTPSTFRGEKHETSNWDWYGGIIAPAGCCLGR